MGRSGARLTDVNEHRSPARTRALAGETHLEADPSKGRKMQW